MTAQVLGIELTTKNDIYVNYLYPAVGACLLFILHFTGDIVIAYRHFCDDNEVWGALTIFFMYLPVLGCFIITVSSWELWPEYEGCGITNVQWALLKMFEHLFFPVWSMWRFAEKIFWGIEGVRGNDDASQREAVDKITSPRTIELYYFLQGYLQAAPQILLQLNIVMRSGSDLHKDTADAVGLCLIMSLSKMALTTTLFQRFKSQKICGKQYPWLKSYKYPYDVYRQTYARNIIRKELRTSKSETAPSSPECDSPQRALGRRRSSDFYLQPSTSSTENDPGKLLGRETSIADGPERTVFREIDDNDFKFPRRLKSIKGLPEDDIAGKIVSFLWWYCFLVARMLAISSFAYFYPVEVVWLLSSHFILVVALLLYDVRADEVRRAKAIFFIFIGFVYLFCLIEFKIRFKKARFIYNGFFLLMFSENFIMCYIWWFRDVDMLIDDWWYRYTFNLIVGCSVLSLSSMLLYIKVLKPKKVEVATVPI